MNRECGTCTKCCDGTLTTNINGNEVKLGKPCVYLTIGKGCNIYEERPQNPCKSYQCAWIINNDIPDFMKPENSNCILDYDEKNGIKYLRLISSEVPYTAETLSWCINYAQSNNINLVWSINEKNYHIGDGGFVVEQITTALKDRSEEILKANNLNLSSEETKIQYQWIKGIYEDAASIVKAFK